MGIQPEIMPPRTQALLDPKAMSGSTGRVNWDHIDDTAVMVSLQAPLPVPSGWKVQRERGGRFGSLPKEEFHPVNPE